MVRCAYTTTEQNGHSMELTAAYRYDDTQDDVYVAKLSELAGHLSNACELMDFLALDGLTSTVAPRMLTELEDMHSVVIDKIERSMLT